MSYRFIDSVMDMRAPQKPGLVLARLLAGLFYPWRVVLGGKQAKISSATTASGINIDIYPLKRQSIPSWFILGAVTLPLSLLVGAIAQAIVHWMTRAARRLAYADTPAEPTAASSDAPAALFKAPVVTLHQTPETPDPMQRFLSAQQHTYNNALVEIQAAKKQTSWMSAIFPVLSSLGELVKNPEHAIADLAEARAYLQHKILGARLIEITQAIYSLPRGTKMGAVLGEDAGVLQASMTLFYFAANEDNNTDAKQLFERVLGRFFDGRHTETQTRIQAARRRAARPE